MHSPRPYGLLVLGEQPTQSDENFIESLVRSFTNFTTLSNLDNHRLVRTLPDGGYTIVQNMGGTLRVIVNKRNFDNPDFKPDGMAHEYIPMLFCGVITKSYPRNDEGVGIRLTMPTKRRLTNYEDQIDQDVVELQRFKIEYGLKFKYFEPSLLGSRKPTQYVLQRPTWYSGAMAEVIQIVGGYGRQDFENLPLSPLEQTRFKLPAKVYENIIGEIDQVRLPGYLGVPDKDGQFQYDYKHSLCNTVSFDSNNKPWLTNIDSSGVYVMPLPVIPATTTFAFRNYIVEMGDEELLKILDRFGGLPSGEKFPSGNDLQTWLRAGVVVKVCDTSDFYQHSAMYLACGWSFNSRGTEGFNTCWNYAANGLLHVHGYKMRLSLQSAENEGRIGSVTLSQENTEIIGRYISAVKQRLSDSSPRDIAIHYKLRRMKESDLLDRARTAVNSNEVSEDEINYLDALTLDPIAKHSGNVARVSSGPVYYGGLNPLGMGRIKFPNLFGTGCESFIMISPDYNGDFVRSDTIMFGCYVDDQLKVIKFFSDNRKFYREVESTFDEVMIVGSWDKTETIGNSGLQGFVYTSDFDDRQEIAPQTVYTYITGQDMGYGGYRFQTPGIFSRVGSLSRTRYYKNITKVKTTSGFDFDVGACVPVFMRDAMLYAYQDSTSGTSESEKHTQGSVADPTSYQLWCYDSIFHNDGWTGSGCIGDPPSINGTPVYVDTMIYNPTIYSDFADSGNWFGLPGGGFLDVTDICGPYTSRTSPFVQAGGVVIGGQAPGFQPYSNTINHPGKSSGLLKAAMSVAGASEVHQEKPQQWYFEFSPLEGGAGEVEYFYRDACKVVFGDSLYANISETNAHGRRFHWGHTRLVDHQAAYHFIGVINE